jgi:hypothetical protein
MAASMAAGPLSMAAGPLWLVGCGSGVGACACRARKLQSGASSVGKGGRSASASSSQSSRAPKLKISSAWSHAMLPAQSGSPSSALRITRDGALRGAAWGGTQLGRGGTGVLMVECSRTLPLPPPAECTCGCCCACLPPLSPAGRGSRGRGAAARGASPAGAAAAAFPDQPVRASFACRLCSTTADTASAARSAAPAAAAARAAAERGRLRAIESCSCSDCSGHASGSAGPGLRDSPCGAGSAGGDDEEESPLPRSSTAPADDDSAQDGEGEEEKEDEDEVVGLGEGPCAVLRDTGARERRRLPAVLSAAGVGTRLIARAGLLGTVGRQLGCCTRRALLRPPKLICAPRDRPEVYNLQCPMFSRPPQSL